MSILFQFLLLVFGLLYEVVLELHNRQKYKKIRQTRSFVLVEDDQCADDARHPSDAGEDEDDEHGPAPAVDDGQRREKDGEEDAEEGHKRVIIDPTTLIILQKHKIMFIKTHRMVRLLFLNLAQIVL